MDRYEPVLQSMDFRLTYGDCDPAGIVFYAAYFPWFERTYNEWTFGGNHTPESMPELWGATHISKATACEFFVPGMLFDPLRCEMRLGSLGRTSFTMVFDVVHRDREELLARGHIVFVFVDEDRKPTPIPDGLYDALRASGVSV